MGWVSPTSHTDTDTFWTNEGNAYNGDYTTSYALSTAIAPNTWGDGAGGGYLELNIAAIECNSIVFQADYNAASIDEVDIDVYYSADWQPLYTGFFNNSPALVIKAIGSIETVTAVRFRFYNEHDTNAVQARLYEVYFWDTEPKIASSVSGTGVAAMPLTALRYFAAAISGTGTASMGSKLINKIWPKFILEIHDSSGNLICILENAYDIRWVQELNKAHQLGFSMPIDDPKRADILLTNEIWLRDYRSAVVQRKFILSSTVEQRK